MTEEQEARIQQTEVQQAKEEAMEAEQEAQIEQIKEQQAEAPPSHEEALPSLKLQTVKEIRTESGISSLGGLVNLIIGVALAYFGLDLADRWAIGDLWAILAVILGLAFILVGGGRFLKGMGSLLRPTFQFLNYHKVDCPHCGGQSRVSIRWFQYVCQTCRREFVLDLKDQDRPKRDMVDGGRVCSCGTPIRLFERAAWFTCSKCNSRVELAAVPAEWYRA